MNVEIHTEIEARVDWNALEATILKEIHGWDDYPQDADYTLDDAIKLNSRIARAFDPDDDSVTLPDRFFDPDNCGTHRNPVQDLFDRTETLIANLDRLKVRINEFEYDPDAEL